MGRTVLSCAAIPCWFLLREEEEEEEEEVVVVAVVAARGRKYREQN